MSICRKPFSESMTQKNVQRKHNAASISNNNLFRRPESDICVRQVHTGLRPAWHNSGTRFLLPSVLCLYCFCQRFLCRVPLPGLLLSRITPAVKPEVSRTLRGWMMMLILSRYILTVKLSSVLFLNLSDTAFHFRFQTNEFCSQIPVR